MAKTRTNQQSWKFVGGRLCLNFINTVGGRTKSGAVLRDKLANYDDLLEWGRLGDLVGPAETRRLARLAASRRRDAEGCLRRALRLREALFGIFKSAADGRRPRAVDLDILGQELRIARAHERLKQTGRAFAWTWEGGKTALDRILWPISQSAAELLTSSHLSRLRQCGGNECGWLFLDTSRNGSRLWCDMKDCGNRAKVQRFRSRQKRRPAEPAQPR